MSQPPTQTPSHCLPTDSGWKSLCTAGGIAAWISILLALAEIAISFFPGVQAALARTVTVADWFALFQSHWLLGLRSFGLLNLVGAMFYVPMMLAVCRVLQRENEAYAILAAAVFFIGIAVYFANSRAFPMLELSRAYASAATEAQRSLLAAAGQTLLVEAQSRSGLLIVEVSFLLVSAAMLKSAAFGKLTAWTGIAAGALMMTLEIAFMPPHGIGIAVAAAAGLALMTWSFLIGLRLLQFGR